MAQQQQVDESAGIYEQFFIVAEDTWKLCGESTTFRNQDSVPIIIRQTPTKFYMNFGGFEWECAFAKRQELTLKCNNKDENIQFEMYLCDVKFMPLIPMPTRFNNSYSVRFCRNDCLIMTIRMLKKRSALPDFTSEYVKIGHLKSNHTLKVGGQAFHVNKELLSMYSHFFDRMFNGDFAEAKKAESDLATESANPKLFHDFLAFMLVCPGGCRVLPNRTNVVGLMQLARFYQVDFLMETCKRFLENCHEMPPWERVIAAKKLGLKELKFRIANKLSTMEAWKELALKIMEDED